MIYIFSCQVLESLGVKIYGPYRPENYRGLIRKQNGACELLNPKLLDMNPLEVGMFPLMLAVRSRELVPATIIPMKDCE